MAVGIITIATVVLYGGEEKTNGQDTNASEYNRGVEAVRLPNCTVCRATDLRPMVSDAEESEGQKAVASALGGESVDVTQLQGEDVYQLHEASSQASIEGEINEERPTIIEQSIREEPTRPTVYTSESTVANGFTATRYGESYNGQTVGCSGFGVYDSGNASILAAPPSRYREWPCGTELKVCNPRLASEYVEAVRLTDKEMHQGGCIYVRRVDSCPGCGANHIDLSERGLMILCGGYQCDRLSGLTVEIVR